MGRIFKKTLIVSTLIFFAFFSLFLKEASTQSGLGYLVVILRGNCFFTVRFGGKTVGMNYEKGFGETSEGVVYSGPYSEPQYMVAVEPYPGIYYVELLGLGGQCDFNIQLMKGESVTFNKTFSRWFEEGEFLQMVFTLRKFGQDYAIWESEIEDFHKPYLEVLPKVIEVGFFAGKNQEVSIIVRAPSRVPPTGVSGAIVPAENVTFSSTDLTGGEAPAFEIPKELISFSENGFSVEPNSSKVIKLRITIPEEVRNIEYIGYISVKSSIGNEVIILKAIPDDTTRTYPLTGLPTLSFEINKMTVVFPKIDKDGEVKVDIPQETELCVNNLQMQAKKDLMNVKLVIEKIEKDILSSMNISPIDRPSYQYFKIDKNVYDEEVSQIKIRFGVSKTWITENGIDLNKIKMYRFENGDWQSLETQKIDEDEDFVSYESKTAKFSVYTIAEEKISAFSYWYLYFIPVVIVLIIAIYFLIKKSISSSL